MIGEEMVQQASPGREAKRREEKRRELKQRKAQGEDAREAALVDAPSFQLP